MAAGCMHDAHIGPMPISHRGREVQAQISPKPMCHIQASKLLHSLEGLGASSTKCCPCTGKDAATLLLAEAGALPAPVSTRVHINCAERVFASQGPHSITTRAAPASSTIPHAGAAAPAALFFDAASCCFWTSSFVRPTSMILPPISLYPATH